MKRFYARELSRIARMEGNKLKPNLIPGLIVYLILALGITLFVFPLSSTLLESLIYGALFGFVIYGVYDLTNFSTLKNFSLKMTIADLMWGTFLLGIVSFLTKIISIAR